MTNPRRLVVLVLVALIAVGCGNTPADTGTGTGTGTGGRDQAVQFAECMRDNGVTAFPDPDASGELTIEGSALDPDAASYRYAIDACKDLQPAGFMRPPEVNPEQQDVRLAFARCMRDNGVKDFPDPAPDAPLVDTNRIPSSETEGGMSAINAAMKTCGEVVADALGNQP